MVLDELKILIAFILWIFWGNQTSHQFIGFRSHTNQKNGSPLVRICDFIRFEEMVYTLDVMAPIFRFVVLVQLSKHGHGSRRHPFLCLPCSGRTHTFLVAKNVVYRATKRLKYSHGTQRVNKHMVWTNRTTRQGSRDLNKFLGPLKWPYNSVVNNSMSPHHQ